MKNIMGKPKDDNIFKTAAKETAVKAVKKKYPLVPERMIRRQVNKLDKKLSQKSGFGF